jgi:hypothetical protein
VAETITTTIHATFALSTSYTLTVTDDQGVGRSVTVGTAATTTYWRVGVATLSGSPSTTPGTPYHFLAYLQARLNAGGSAIWSVAINSAGFVVFTYTGVVRAGTITFPDTIVRNVLGYQGNVACSMGGGTSQAPYHPTHVFYSLGLSNSTNWSDDPPLAAIAGPRDGSTYGWSDSAALQTITFDSLFHPYDWDARTTLGLSATASAATPYQGSSTRRKTRSTTAGITPPYGGVDFFYTVATNNSVVGMAKCGALLGNFQAALLGSVSTFDEVYLDPESITRADAWKPSVPNWSLRMSRTGIRLRHYATASF